MNKTTFSNRKLTKNTKKRVKHRMHGGNNKFNIYELDIKKKISYLPTTILLDNSKVFNIFDYIKSYSYEELKNLIENNERYSRSHTLNKMINNLDDFIKDGKHTNLIVIFLQERG